MASTFCPLFERPYYSYTIDLADATYTLRFRWSGRAQQWFMTIEDAEENTLVRNIGLVPYFYLLNQYALESIPGDFILIPYENNSEIDLTSASIPNPREIYKTHFLIHDDFQD